MRDGIEKVVTNDIPIKQVKFCIQVVQTRTLSPQHRSEGSIVLSLGDRSDQIHSIFFTQNRVIIQHYIKKSIKSNIRRSNPKIFKVINETFFNNNFLSKEVTWIIFDGFNLILVVIDFDCSVKIFRVLIIFTEPLIFSPLTPVDHFFPKEGTMMISQSSKPSCPPRIIRSKVSVLNVYDLFFNVGNFIVDMTDA